MGVANVPSAAGGGIKLVQRGSAASSGNVTITAVDINKSFVTVFGTASSGTVAASATVPALNGNKAAGNIVAFGVTYQGRPANSGGNSFTINNWTSSADAIALNSGNLSGGSNNLVAAIVQGFLANSTTLTVSGACRFEVVEFA